MNIKRPFYLLLCAALLASCSDAGGPSEVGVDAGADNGDTGQDNNDPGDTGDSPQDTGDDDGGGDDGGSDDAGEDAQEDVPMEMRQTGELCEEDAQCASRLCLFLEADIDQGFCSEFCITEGDCPDETYDCVFFENSGSDVQNICLPSDLCIDADEDGYGFGPGCDGRDCDDEDPTTNPGAQEVCDGADNDCDGNIDDDPIDNQVECDTGLEGVCATGISFCQDGELLCEQTQASGREFCDGLDNDCDGQTDEGDDGEPLAEVCYNGPEGTEGIGACQAGVRLCQDGRTTDCLEQVLPRLEACDGADNDCDGEVDEDGPDEGVLCETGQPGVCARGVTACQDGEVLCTPVTAASAEICDGRDNDCDGATDENEEGEALTVACYDGPEGTEGQGACLAGARTCADGRFGACEGQVPPEDELCDTFDNDCDGEIDEGNPAGGFVCETGLPGVCASGETLCTEEGTICQPISEASEEVCDGQDNDCDGETDEDADGEVLERTCYNGPEGTEGVGACQAGTEVCAEGQFEACDGEILPSVEICDGIDNDCDGEIDENNPGGNIRCDTGQQGVCALGVTACSPEGELICQQIVEPSVEFCDGADNDCDGQTDEDEEGQALTRTCYDGPEGTEGVGACQVGVLTCEDGQFGACEGQVLPAAEVCDGADNNCNGQSDENNPEGGAQCDTGLQGLCSIGRQACQEGELSCVAQQAQGEEVCDGFDNDCDGLVDEGEDGEPLTARCYDGPEITDGVGACQAGVLTCEDGQFGACEGQVLPVAEVCDGQDNDCNGVADENNPGANVRCDTGQDGVCAVGVTLCNEDGQLLCQPVLEASAEVCDGRDNDCDGQTDEDEGGQPLARTCYLGPEGTEGVGACQSGTETCQDGQFGICAGQVLPAAEVCDGEDNDCNGATDEGDPGGGVACTTGQQGVCAVGVSACQSGRVACIPNAEAGEEICDGLDNDCDGTVDNGFAGLGQTCFEGLGICRRVGVFICNPDDRSADPICDADAGVGNDQETCDFNDDDCDGLTDEDFRNEDGVYDTIAHCGSCGINCNNQWPGGPQLYNVSPLCQELGDSAQCAFDCIGDFVDLDDIPDNGCEFLPDPDAIYVSRPANGGSDADPQCGTFDAPCATVSNGLLRADNDNKLRVRVSDGLYRENIELIAGVDVLGGHNARSWSRDPEVNVTILSGNTANPQSADRMTVVADGITSPTEFSGFTVNAESAGGSGNSIGVYVVNSTDALLITNNSIFGGPGGTGVPGAAGDGGFQGADGSTGNTSRTNANGCNFNTGGGAGGARTCGGVNVSGGTGGVANCPERGERSGSGLDGTTAPGPLGDGGDGGLGGGHLEGNVDLNDLSVSCLVGVSIDALPGLAGEQGEDGDGGNGAANAVGDLDLGTAQWRGLSGGNGAQGDHGGGGGGGGAAPGVDAVEWESQIYYGATGGGGGSGGCAAEVGGGGQSGGGSFAVFVAYTNNGPNNASQMPRLENNRVARGQGGGGGAGGAGGAGGDPGLGGAGGEGVNGDDDLFGFCMFDAAIGAPGGRGGHGGGGGGGAGGVSFDIYVHGSNGHQPAYEANNTFELAADAVTGGGGGAGGTANNTDRGLGEEGPRGASGRLLFVP